MGPLETRSAGQTTLRAVVRQSNSAHVRLGSSGHRFKSYEPPFEPHSSQAFQHGVRGIGAVASAAIAPDHLGDFADFVEVEQSQTAVDAPLAIPPRPLVEVAAPNRDLHDLAVLQQPRRGMEIGFTARAVAV